VTQDPLRASTPIRLLFVDDHAMVTDTFCRALDREDDITVIATAATAGDAYDAALAHQPDVILMDYVLPDGNGVTAAARILAELPDSKVILLTGSGAGHGLRAAVTAGCVGYLDKTGSLDKVISAVRAVASGAVIMSREDLTRLIPDPADSRARALTTREREILGLVADGLPNLAIAEHLTLNVTTVRKHVQNMLTKLHAHSRLEAVAVARRIGVLDAV
jgi:DNA-binding NarL/FixJ family response regulator